MNQQITQDSTNMNVDKPEVYDVPTIASLDNPPPASYTDAPTHHHQQTAWSQKQQNASLTSQSTGVINTTVIGQPPATNVTVIQQAAPIRPPNYLALAVVTTICCNIVFGNSPFSFFIQ